MYSLSQCRQKRIETRPQTTCKNGNVWLRGFRVMRVDRQTEKQTFSLQFFATLTGRSNYQTLAVPVPLFTLSFYHLLIITFRIYYMILFSSTFNDSEPMSLCAVKKLLTHSLTVFVRSYCRNFTDRHEIWHDA